MFLLYFSQRNSAGNWNYPVWTKKQNFAIKNNWLNPQKLEFGRSGLMTKKTSRIVAVIMLIIAIIFFVVALNNPQASFPWNNIITYILYGTYIIIMIILFIAPFKGKK